MADTQRENENVRVRKNWNIILRMWNWMNQNDDFGRSEREKKVMKDIWPAEQCMLVLVLSLSVYDADARWNLNETGSIVLLLLFRLFLLLAHFFPTHRVLPHQNQRAQNANNFKRVFLLFETCVDVVQHVNVSVRTTSHAIMILYSVFELLFWFFPVSRSFMSPKTCLNCEYFFDIGFFSDVRTSYCIRSLLCYNGKFTMYTM